MVCKEGTLIKNWDRYQGETLSWMLEFYDEDDQPINITSDAFTLLAEKPDGTDVFALSTSDGLSFPDDHILQVFISSSRTAAAPKNIDINYWIDWVRSGSNKAVPMAGVIRLKYKGQ